MSKRNSIEKSLYINQRYKEYISSSFYIKSPKLQKVFEQQLEQEDLFKGPFIDFTLPFLRGMSLRELIDEGVVCPSFAKLGDLNLDRPLYAHQEETIRHIATGRNAIITTGTGSGKTECFLFPILNEILKEQEAGNRDEGIRAIFLYPMNALVNDQMDRIRRILATYPDITFGFFTGETQEKAYTGSSSMKNEVVSREEIRKHPPHLLFTNFSMLEYILIRPNDYAIFKTDRLKNWKFVVLDEAHTYHGSFGIEIAMLMRRVTGLAPRKPRFILTSATLGTQGKSEQQIIDFAQNLTSVSFDVDDIIFSKRIPRDLEPSHDVISADDYSKLKKEDKEYLFDLLKQDPNVIHVYTSLKDGCKDFRELLSEFDGELTEQHLIDLIDLINRAEKDSIGLFDLKYHSFIRPLYGAYITLESEPQLSLTKTNFLGEMKAFEIGNCRYCNVPYIIGRVQRKDENGVMYLLQNNEVDIYENYGDNQYVNIDYFLMEDSYDEEEIESDLVEKWKVCAKCGAVHVADNLRAKKCKCGEIYERSIYKVTQHTEKDADKADNNIKKCPCCGGSSHRYGVVKSLDIGKDEGTALVAQTLLESMEDKDRENSEAKQILAFSDSRQQASFFATFMDYNHHRFLRKRLIWETIEDCDYRDIGVDELISILSDKIKREDLFDNDLSSEKNAWATVLIDLLKVDGLYDGEGMGLYYFDLDMSDIFEKINEEDVQREFGIYELTKADLVTIVNVVFDVFKTTPAIRYVQSGLTKNERNDILSYRRFDNAVTFKAPKMKKNTKSFLPIKFTTNKNVRYIQKVCNCDGDTAKKILDIIFNNLALCGGLMKPCDGEGAYQIEASKYVIKNYKRSKYYICSKCGKMTPRNVHDRCPQDKCEGVLQEVDPDVAFAKNYYRDQYKKKKIERIVTKEHTAQIDKEKGKVYQQEFKEKKINILSCSTTFEMGIDIGDLETVFMRNMPPSPANYVQRAGRAGRRKDSEAYILTYCNTRSHDFTYFQDPQKMISGLIDPPSFQVSNQKIIIRHLVAICLGFFFREYPQYYENINNLVFEGGLEKFKEYVESCPENLNEYINNKVIPGDEYSLYHNFNWYVTMQKKDEKLDYFAHSIKSMLSDFETAKVKAVEDEKYSDAEYYKKQIENLKNNRVIDKLSEYCVIPKYGFPIDVVDLQVFEDGRYICALSRDLKIAISEYAPDSEVMLDKKKYVSKYITLPKTGDITRHYYCTCPKCAKVNSYVSEATVARCKYCGEDLSAEKLKFYIEPTYGFRTGNVKKSSQMKPKRSYSGEVLYLGGGSKDAYCLTIQNDLIKVETSSDDELLIMNRSNFYMCPTCGYSDISKGHGMTPVVKKKHINYKGYDCECTALNKVKLGHRFKTDVARFTIPKLESCSNEGNAQALSVLYALLEGISDALGIERNDIEGILEQNLDNRSYDIIIYDNVPGGAGHVKRLLDKDAIYLSLKSAYEKVSQNCCDEHTSCYNCLRNYYNQTYHSRLQRGYAKEFIGDLLTQIEGDWLAR